MTEELKSGLKELAKNSGMAYKEVLRIATQKCMPAQNERSIYYKIQSIKTIAYLKHEFGLDITKPQISRKGQGFIYMTLIPSNKPITRIR